MKFYFGLTAEAMNAQIPPGSRLYRGGQVQTHRPAFTAARYRTSAHNLATLPPHLNVAGPVTCVWAAYLEPADLNAPWPTPDDFNRELTEAARTAGYAW